MRNAFADEVAKLAQADPRVVLLSGDIGNKLFDPVKLVDESRFYNCGIAEGNMMGVAAGMALSGLRPIVYTITPFTTTRCFEQIRVDVCYHKAPVIIVGTGSGLSYAELGPTHHSLEDIAILRSLPSMRVVAPCDANELRSVMREALNDNAPTYIRIGKKGETKIFPDPPKLKIGKSHKGIVNAIGLGRYDHDNSVYLSLILKRIKYHHEVEVKLPMIIYGNIPDKLEKIIDEINIKKDANKYNL